MEKKEPILVVKDLKQHFKINRNFTVKAVDGISFDIMPGETYGLVGESGSGKSTTGRSIIRLYKPTSGSIVFNGKEIGGKLDKATAKELHTKMQMIFQDPMACLNPRKKVIDIIGQGLDIHKSYSSIEERNELIKKQPAYGNIICRCEMITEGEILDAIHRTLGARSLDAVKRRTRAGMGRCQAGFCSPKTMEILEREVPMSMFDVTKNGKDAKIVFGYNKKI